MSSPNGTQAVERAAQLLIQVTRHREPVTFAELTEESGLAKSTTSRLLTALERSGLVRRDTAGRFRPGEVLVSYACRGDAEADLVSVAQPILDRLGAQTGETVNLGVPRGGGMVEQIAQVDSTYLIGGTNWVGMSVPLHCAALGKVLLAYGAAQLPRGRLEQRTGKTLTSRAALEADLAGVRERGWAVTDEELEPGLVAVAAPVRRDGGAVIAAMSVSAPAGRLTPAAVPTAAARCATAAGSLSALLGYRPGAPEPGAPEHSAPEHSAPEPGAPEHSASDGKPGAPEPGAPDEKEGAA
jgi:IclR family acetate operon transcriptional repressor